MFSIVECITHQHDYTLVVLAAGICLIGCFTFFLLLNRAQECTHNRQRHWRLTAAVAGGVGIWATHFLAMLAYKGSVPMSFAPGLTIASVAFVIGIWWIGLVAIPARSGLMGATVTGVILTLGIAVMHYSGIAAIEIPGRISINLSAAFWASVISAILVCAAFLAFDHLPHRARLIAPPLLLVLGIVSLHFGGMTAMAIVPDPRIAIPETSLSKTWLTGSIFIATTALITLSALAVFLDRYLTDLKGLTDATLDGLLICRDGRIIESNARMAALCGVSLKQMIGQSPDTYLTFDLIDDDSAAGVLAVDGVLRPVSGEMREVEVTRHQLEYRGRLSDVLGIHDVTETKLAQRQVEHMARHDGLTGLPNRTLLEERLHQALAMTERAHSTLAVLALDLDRFKAVNDIFGHARGDEILRRVADILRSATRAGDTVARIGGDEFVIVQMGGAQPEAARHLCERILATFAEEMDTARDPTAVGVSIGVAVGPQDAHDADGLRHCADIALYRAKQAGRGNARFFDLEMDNEVRARRALEHDLRHAILRSQLSIAYQPLVATATGQISGYEALLRWNHPDLGQILPERFIPIAEESGTIVALGEWVLTEACEAAAHWSDDLIVAVNVSTVQFQVPNLVDVVDSVLKQTGLSPGRLEIEITESVLIRDKRGALETLKRLKALGVRIVMDDFGTGYSSLSNLQSFPFDKLKIDRSFVSALEADGAARSIVRAIVGLGRSLKLPVVAEGVETEAQRRMVHEEGCPQAQGFLFGEPGRPPMPAVILQVSRQAL
ncbi:MAG: EAL domain-containing protein [Asticcacaulis sp.]|uniref:bifunctional diguanylate cyclase/phosphodiesterase n=1 Tax=Asticcacaulis sp. TaxID=1872648 RepID=UPI0039E58DE2